MFRIGEFARLAGVSAKMLRAWDALGLFRPAWVDPDTGYRGYSPAQLPELRRILALRDVGVPLAEIAVLVDGAADLRSVLERRREQLELERREVERRLQALEITVAMAGDRGGSAVARDRRGELDVVVRPVAAERVAILEVGADEDVGDAFYELETCVRDQRRRAARPPGAILDDRPGTGGGRIFVPITGPLRPCGRVVTDRFAACRVASALHRGSYAGLPVAREALEDWVRAAGLAPSGPLRILYLQFGAEAELGVPERYLVRSAADLVTELQQPIAPS